MAHFLPVVRSQVLPLPQAKVHDACTGKDSSGDGRRWSNGSADQKEREKDQPVKHNTQSKGAQEPTKDIRPVMIAECAANTIDEQGERGS